MESWLWNKVNPETFVQVVLILFLLLGVAWLKWPEIKKRISEGPLKDKQMQDADENLSDEIRKISEEIRKYQENVKREIQEIKGEMLSMKDKLANDYSRINMLERNADQMRKLAESSLEERQILMECNLAQLNALSDMGAKVETGVDAAQRKLHEYLNKKAHNI